MGWFDEQGFTQGFTPGDIVPGMPGFVFGEDGQPVPMEGGVPISAGGGTAVPRQGTSSRQPGQAVPGLPGYVYGPDGITVVPEGGAATQTPTSAGAYGTSVNLDPAYLTQRITAAFQQSRGRGPTAEELQYWIGKATTPEMYSDGLVRVGWNPYWEARIAGGDADSADVRLAGMEGVLDRNTYANLYAEQAAAGQQAAQGQGTFDLSTLQPPPDYTAPERPSYLQGQFTLPEFQMPTKEEFLQSPGVQAGADLVLKGNERKAAAQGSILSGGYGARLGKALTDYANTTYDNFYNQRLNAYTQGQLSPLLAARGVNENAYQDDVTNMLNQYGRRYGSYRDRIGDQFNLAELGLRGITAGRP